jgi:BASS family bile acid:Na+ symporter
MAEALQHIEKASLFTFLVGSMLATGLGLGMGSIMQPLTRARIVILATLLNFVLAPAAAWLLTLIIPLQQGHATGLLLLGGAAGAPFLPSIVKMARGDVACASAVMLLCTFGTIFFMSLALPLFVAGLSMHPWEITRPLLLLIVVPLLAGMMLRPIAACWAEKGARLLSWVGNAALLVFSVVLLARNLPALMHVIGSGAIAAALIYFVLLFAAGWLVGGSSPEVKGAMALGVSARNFGAAFIPATGSLRDPGIIVMLTVSAIVGLASSFFAARWVRRRTLAQPHTFAPRPHITRL